MPSDSVQPSGSLRPNRSVELTGDKVFEILWTAAKEAFFMAFTVGIMGTIAIGILSGICGEMTPSLPPGLGGESSAHWWHASKDAIHRHSFALLFLAILVLKSALALVHYSNDSRLRKAAARVLRATRRISSDWFSLLIKNAFAAFVGVLVLQCMQNFTLTHLLWEAVKAIFTPALEAAGRLLGGGLSSLLGLWFEWYGDNQTKFSFWLLYSAALCDDLGLPNYKTLARRVWERVCNISERGKATSS
jgi:hypothetical protein